MARREKIAITVQDSLLQQVERLRKKSGESRSAVFERALVAYLGAADRTAISQRYADAYRRSPESRTERDEAMSRALPALSAEAWDAAR